MTDSYDATMPHTPDTVTRMVSGGSDHSAFQDRKIAHATSSFSAMVRNKDAAA
ncbi:hypothetical protein SRCM100623_02340 [Acetobacter pasteurianus]|uniref:Uncharacterized protein n=1 Tax=Acetobacter pasteurianus TaxID=438 RepID=A0A1A0D1I0_ACEPA|nr:hypothetical protein SRCM100623_02340 [Acetobacter pasteurianus]